MKQTGDIGARKKTNNKWFETQDSIGYWDDFFSEKITWGNLNLEASYCLAEAGMFINAPCPMIVPANKYLLAVLNSKLADYYIRGLGVTRNGGYFEYKPMFVEQLPIPIIPDKEQNIFIELVEKVLTAGSTKNMIENEIENLIFRLYDISPEEALFITSKLSDF